MLHKNQIIPLTITDITHECNGIGRHDGMAVFVPMTSTGDEINARIVKINKNFAFGRVEEIITPSPSREKNKCPVYNRCGGCSLRHISYEEELMVKSRWVSQNISRIGGFKDFVCDDIIPSPATTAYRNKAQYPLAFIDGKIRAGFYAQRSHDVIPNTSCLLQPNDFQIITLSVLEFLNSNNISCYNEKNGEGLVRHIYIRQGAVTKETMVCLVATEKNIPQIDKLVELLLKLDITGEIVSVVVNTNPDNTNVILGDHSHVIYGKDGITDELAGVRVDISSQAFYQVNHDATELLYAEAISQMGLTGSETVVELYCGAGTISLPVAKKAKEVIAVEIVAEAIEDAKRNAEKNNINNITFICEDALTASTKIVEDNIKPDIVVVDPPRKGCDQGVIDSIVKMSPKKLVYISCNSSTLARDCKLLAENGYKLEKAVPCDLFPRTGHVECVALMSK